MSTRQLFNELHVFLAAASDIVQDREENKMRIDKFLKVSRLVKRRTVAKEMADQGE